MRKFFSALCALLLLSLSLSALAESNLLVNGDFSQAENGLPVGWEPEMWITDAGVSTLSIDPDGYEGSCIFVGNAAANDARFAQTVEVKPDTIYRVSCMCKASDIPTTGIGATISIKDTFCYTESLRDTGGEWVRLTLYGITGPEQYEMTVLARIGGYSNETPGQAWFDSFELIEIEAAPQGVDVVEFSPLGSSSGSGFTAVEEEPEEPERNTEMYVLLTAMYMLLVLAVVRKYGRRPLHRESFYNYAFLAVLAAALALRVVLAVKVPGYNTDINCFSSWSKLMASEGPVAFYRSGVWCDYPPLYMWLLGPIGLLRSVLGLPYRSGLDLLLLKLWPILFDMACAYLIWLKAKPRLGGRAALLLAAFFALNPAVFTDSAAWGQIDSVFTLLVALCALEACEERYHTSLTAFALAMLIKPQALLFAPLGLFAIIVNFAREGAFAPLADLLAAPRGAWERLVWKESRRSAGRTAEPLMERPGFRRRLFRLLTGLAAALGILYLAGLISVVDPSKGFLYNLTQPVVWLKELYSETMSGYSYVTVNTLNVYYLFDLNWARSELHPTATTIAWILFALTYVYCGVMYVLSRNRRHLPLIGGLLIVLICTFGPMIHERYIFPAVLLLILGYVYARDKRILISLTVLSATLFLNEILVLQGGMTEANYGHLQAGEDWLNLIVSTLNVYNALFLAWTVLDICALRHEYPLARTAPEAVGPGQRELYGKQSHRLNLTRIDALLMTVVTLLYAVVAFTNLGSTKAPQTTWTSGSAGESVVFDLGETERFRMTYYGNICNTNFTVELSNDGEVWTTPYYAKYNQGEIFRWLWYVPQNADGSQAAGVTSPTTDGTAYVAFAGYEGETYPFQTARYVRLRAVAPNLKLSEVGFLDENGVPLPIASAEQHGDFTVSSAELLTDEQDTIPAVPSYYNSTYFDEIYHARTAYEHLHGLSTYEWTHPPLGKVLMMLGIQLFGMTPFGWRFMGALMGVMMVPLMYLLVKQLTKSTKLSFIAMFLLSVDAMHFTQTRIATIDSYAVFWIMLMYFFMLRYSQMKWTSCSDFLKSLVPLGLCGLTMGVAWATKWIGLYASVGLAVIFFWTLYRRFREYHFARAELRADSGNDSPLLEDTAEMFWPRAVGTVAFCLIFFVAIPVLTYYFSHFWYLRGMGSAMNVSSFADMFSMDAVREVIDLQERIFNYHAGLGGDTHYFRSPWYQWPIIWWPMWFYSGSSYVASGMVSSISCMGNPAVWWFGLAAMIFVIIRMCLMRRAPKAYLLVVIGFASQFLPWVLVPRSTFIYHYFASVPFIIMASVLFLRWIRARSETAFKATAITLMAAALVLFIAFYPLESGLPVARSYANLLRWFKWVNF